jgi:hypothetical protein
VAGNQIGGQGAGFFFFFEADQCVDNVGLVVEIIRLARGCKLVAFEGIFKVAVLGVQLADLHVDPFGAAHDEVEVRIAADAEAAGHLLEELGVLLEGSDVVAFVLKGFGQKQIDNCGGFSAQRVFRRLQRQPQVLDRLFVITFDKILAAELELGVEVVGLELRRTLKSGDGHVGTGASGEIRHGEGVVDLG